MPCAPSSWRPPPPTSPPSSPSTSTNPSPTWRAPSRTSGCAPPTTATTAPVRRHDIAETLAATGHDDTLQLRGDRELSDLWLPYTYVEHTLRAAPSAPWSGIVTITREPTDASWDIDVAADGSARLEPLGIDYQPQRLSAEHMERLRSVLMIALPPESRRTPQDLDHDGHRGPRSAPGGAPAYRVTGVRRARGDDQRARPDRDTGPSTGKEAPQPIHGGTARLPRPPWPSHRP